MNVNNNTQENLNKIRVYRMSKNEFVIGKKYYFAFYTEKEGEFPNIKYYTNNELKYLGKYLSYEEYGYHDNSCIIYTFIDNNGEENKINLDYEGKSCFLEVETDLHF